MKCVWKMDGRESKEGGEGKRNDITREKVKGI